MYTRYVNRSLLQNIVSFIGRFCKRDLQFEGASHNWIQNMSYGVAATSRLLKTTGLFCRISSLLQGAFAKETYNLKEPLIIGYKICRMGWLRLVGFLKL